RDDEPEEHGDHAQAQSLERPLRRQDRSRVAQEATQLVLVTRDHDRRARRTATWCVLAVMICAANNHYVAADVRAVALQNRAADRAHVLFDPTFDDHIAAKRDHAMLDLTADDDRAPEANH